ncbi:MAG: ABC1/COQ8 ser/thr kinase [Monoraphidium minutum]|nr:MAG: ABC1/COQ8 ser/thr kinase [Monoraphidium minutum]
MYRLCIDLRGFYLKAGQFIGARADFVPEQVCRQLCVLQDRVPPMTADRTLEVLQRELGVDDLGELFEWIDLENPLGSASISQVHKAQLRRFSPRQLREFGARRRGAARLVSLRPGDTPWSVCNDAGISLAELAAANPGVDMDGLQPGDAVRVPEVLALAAFQDAHLAGRLLGSEGGGERGRGGGAWSSGSGTGGGSEGWLETSSSYGEEGGGGGGGGGVFGDALVNGIGRGGAAAGLGRLLSGLRRVVPFGGGGAPAVPERPVTTAAAAAVAHAVAVGSVPSSGLVAVKVQYPDALQVMSEDLVNLRTISAFLSKTELKFDLVSAVDELQRQIHLEFDFMREARVMDSIATHLSPIASRVAVPRSVPGLVTTRVMAMTFMEGTPLMQLQSKVAHLPKWQRDKAARLILSHLSEAYGRMILGEGLFQADGHPGNILVRPGGGIALLDYGQSKQLPGGEREALARLVLALNREDTPEISGALQGLGIVLSKDDAGLRREVAYGMFDTRGTVDPFDPSSPIKRAAIQYFPPDMFFVLRVVQLLRGIANGMGVTDFSSASQWAPFARDALAAADKRRGRGGRAAQPRRVPPLAALMTPLRLSA